MDRREMKKQLQYALMRELWQDQPNQYGETRQEVILSKMNIYDPSEAVRRRFLNLVTELMVDARLRSEK
jgi:hypothetical protein